MHPLTNEEKRKLEGYRRALPENEYTALCAWLTTFYPFQRDWMLENADMAVCLKARQIGISHTTAAVLVLWGVFHGETTTAISVGDREAQEVLEKAKRHREVLVGLGSRMAAVVGKDNASEIQFASGGRAIALPSTGGRSFTGNAFLDEFAYHKRPTEVWDAALAITLLGFKARVASTPNGVGNEFHELCTDPAVNDGWAIHEIPIDVATSQGYPVDIDKCWKIAKGDPRIFDQLFKCKFLDNVGQYFPSDLLKAALASELAEKGQTFGGLDIGEERDRTTLVIVRREGKELHTVHIESHKKTDDQLLDELAAKAFGAWKCKRLAADATGLGSMPAKAMRRKHGQKFEPVKFTLQVKEELVTGLYTDLAGDTFRIPKSYQFNGEDEGAELQADLAAIKRIVTTAGNVRYDAARTTKGHADRAWALMLARHAASLPSSSLTVGTEPIGLM